MQTEVAREFDAVHNVARALDVGSLDAIATANELRPALCARLERAVEPERAPARSLARRKADKPLAGRGPSKQAGRSVMVVLALMPHGENRDSPAVLDLEQRNVPGRPERNHGLAQEAGAARCLAGIAAALGHGGVADDDDRFDAYVTTIARLTISPCASA